MNQTPKKSCSGPCDQGRKPCATPAACELDELTEKRATEKAVENLVVTMLVFLIACCSYFVWKVLGL